MRSFSSHPPLFIASCLSLLDHPPYGVAEKPQKACSRRRDFGRPPHSASPRSRAPQRAACPYLAGGQGPARADAGADVVRATHTHEDVAYALSHEVYAL